MALLAMSKAKERALVDEMVNAAKGGYDLPAPVTLDLDIPPYTAAAARFLVELLLEETP